MDAGAAALIFGIAAVVAFSVLPEDWRKAAGGLLIALTVMFVVIDAVQLLAH